MKDLIDERNEKERIRKSIVKRWNVNYVPYSVLPPGGAQAAAGDMALMGGDGKHAQDGYNKTTGAYSGLYGRGASEVDEVAKEQIDRILHEKSDAFHDFLEEEKGQIK